ncbi:hypothetical protein AIIMSE5_005 [Acinetobacter phage AIIMS-AbE5-RC]|uniref:Uncharacterized protein n=1 Tax=Acinetobacter phage AIIMS-AbE5-RC TaxID=2981552 RepID=A0A9X9JPZ2_9CAUD|nr:hypothetical protein AIIMSE5_005 [Acinetobacter phage AIIMS-AbE5-RC]
MKVRLQPVKEAGSDNYLRSKKYYPYIGYALFTQEQYDYLDKYCFAENTELLTPEELIYKAGQRSVMYKIQTLINQTYNGI